MARICSQHILIDPEEVDGPTERCQYETVHPRSSYCQWHRLLRTTMPGQEAARKRRLRDHELSGAPFRARVPAAEWPPGERWCAGCQSMIPLFYCSGSRCRACAREDRAIARRETVYGLEDDIWRQIMELQDGLCAICRRQQQDRAPAVEHNHRTKKVRGGCCVTCNKKLLGGAFDSPRILAAALVYLLCPPTSGLWIKPEDGAVDSALWAVDEALERLRQRRQADLKAQRIALTLAGAYDPDGGITLTDALTLDDTDKEGIRPCTH